MCCSATTLPPSPRPARCWGRCWPPSSATCRARSGSSSAACWPARCTTWWCSSPRCGTKGRACPDRRKRDRQGRPGAVASFAILFILILTLAGLSIAVVNAMFESPWGTFTVFCHHPHRLHHGHLPARVRAGRREGRQHHRRGACCSWPSWPGPYVAANPTLSAIFTLSKPQTIALIIPIYGFVASVLPVWLLLCPRDYLSTYLKIGTIAMLAIGIFFVHPHSADGSRSPSTSTAAARSSPGRSFPSSSSPSPAAPSPASTPSSAPAPRPR